MKYIYSGYRTNIRSDTVVFRSQSCEHLTSIHVFIGIHEFRIRIHRTNKTRYAHTHTKQNTGSFWLKPSVNTHNSQTVYRGTGSHTHTTPSTPSSFTRASNSDSTRSTHHTPKQRHRWKKKTDGKVPSPTENPSCSPIDDYKFTPTKHLTPPPHHSSQPAAAHTDTETPLLHQRKG